MKISKKQIIIVITLLLILLLLVILFIVITGFISKKNITVINDSKVEVYSKHKVSEFISIPNGKILEDFLIDTTTLGMNEISFKYKDKYGKHKHSFKINIEDTTKPLIWVSGSYTYTIGSNKKIEDIVLCADNYDKRPACWIEGNYNLEEVGNYSVKYIAKDKSGNVEEIPFTLIVKEKSSNSSGTSSSSGISLEEIKKQYLTEDVTLGIDVSKWQSNINWAEVKKQGIEFAMIRLGTQIGINKESTLDSYFEKNIKEATKVGIKVGVYYYSYATSVKEAKEQALWVVKQLEKYKLDLPIVFDWECYSYFNSFNISLYDLNEIANTFLKTVT